MGVAPTQQQSIIGLQLKSKYIYIMNIIQLLLSGGSTQGLPIVSITVAVGFDGGSFKGFGFRVQGLGLGFRVSGLGFRV